MSNQRMIPPRMTSLPKLVDTYDNVCGTTRNPFTYAPLTGLGFDHETCHDFMHVLHGSLPVMADYTRMESQIVLTITENLVKYQAMKTALDKAATINPVNEFDYTDTTVHSGGYNDAKTGKETKTRTGSQSDSGTDSTTNGGTVTDATTTFDNATLRNTAQSTQDMSGSITYGKTTTYNSVADELSFSNDRKNTRTYDDYTITRTVEGHKTNPAALLQAYTDFVRNNNVFYELINDVIRAISCIVYIPFTPISEEEE